MYYTPTTEAEENEIKNFYISIQKEIDHTPQQDMLTITGDWHPKTESKADSNLIGILDKCSDM